MQMAVNLWNNITHILSEDSERLISVLLQVEQTKRGVYSPPPVSEQNLSLWDAAAGSPG